MSSASGALFCLLTLSLVSHALSQPRSSDEETLRGMTERYGLAIGAGDLAAIREYWNPQSADLAARFKSYQNLFSETHIEFISPKVIGLEVTGDKAVSHMTADERRLDKKTGAILLPYDPLRGTCRSFEWIRTSAGWKVEREFLVQDELAARLEAAASDGERDDLLEKSKVVVTNTLTLALSNRGIRHQVRGNYDAALRCFQLQQAVAEKMSDRAGIAGAWLNVGQVNYAQDDNESGLRLTHNALALYETLGIKRGVALALEQLSSIYRTLGDHRRAFDCAQKALRLCEEENHRRGTSEALFKLAVIYGIQNNPEQALAHLERALAIARELGDVIKIASLRHDVAVQHQKLGNYERALEIYKDLLKQTEDFGDRAGAAMIRNQIGKVLAVQGEYDEALSYYRRSLAQLEAVNMKRATVVVLNDLSGAYLAQGKYAEALLPAEQALSMSRESGRPLDLWVALTYLGYSQFGLNRPEEARQSFAEAVSIIEKLRAQTAGGVQERQRYFEGGLLSHHGMLSLLVKENQAREALVFAERTKARVLLDILQQGQISVQKTMSKEEQEDEHRLKSELTQLNKQLARATESDKPDAAGVSQIEPRLEKGRLNYEAFQNSLYAAHPELKVRRGEAPVISAQELTALLPHSSTALVEYVVTNDKIYLFAVTKAGEKAEAEVQVYSLPIKRMELAKQIEAFRRQLATRDLGFRASAVKLYDLLLKPAEGQLRGKTNLVIAPDDVLWDLPFQALLVRSNRFLIEDAALAYAPSLTVLREMTRRRRSLGADAGSATLFALGNPLPGKGTVNRTAMTVRDENLDPLPEAEQEVKALRRLYGISRSKVYIGAEAREDRVKSEAGQARILHFATHGIVNNASPMYSHLVLAEGDANEDGLLEAWELTQLDLKADLAVLSACETARGRIGAGEGMIGLSWAMFIAGVPSIVVSQWKVESAGTRDLMVNFHRALISEQQAGKAKLTKAEALRQAALKLMKNAETRHPFYWAGFVLVGEGR